MRLFIVSDSIDPCLSYIWSQFSAVNRLETPWTLVTYNDFRDVTVDSMRSGVLEYSNKKRFDDSLLIIKQQNFQTDCYNWIRSDLPVFEDSCSSLYGKLRYDLFFNAFVHLSRLEEWQKEMEGKRILSYASRHPRKITTVWQLPVVNILFNELEKRITYRWPDVCFGPAPKAEIEFSHDVDYIEKTTQLKIKQSAGGLIQAALFFKHAKKDRNWKWFADLLKFAALPCAYWCFDDWMALDSSLDIKPVYYLYAKTNRFSNSHLLKKWLLDPSYDIKTNKALQSILARLLASGAAIGLHGSYLSATDERIFRSEYELLKQVSLRGISKTRQHWLNYMEQKTPFIHEKTGIHTDSSIGFNDIAGFRAGIASEYVPYNHKANRPFSFTEVPLVIMDSHLSHDRATGNDLEWFFNAGKTAKSFKVSVDWHQRSISPDYRWDYAYRNLAVQHKSSLT